MNMNSMYSLMKEQAKKIMEQMNTPENKIKAQKFLEQMNDPEKIKEAQKIMVQISTSENKIKAIDETPYAKQFYDATGMKASDFYNTTMSKSSDNDKLNIQTKTDDIIDEKQKIINGNNSCKECLNARIEYGDKIINYNKICDLNKSQQRGGKKLKTYKSSKSNKKKIIITQKKKSKISKSKISRSKKSKISRSKK